MSYMYCPAVVFEAASAALEGQSYSGGYGARFLDLKVYVPIGKDYADILLK